MSLVHLRLRGRLSLLASDVLDGPERDKVLAHAEECAKCRAELQELRELLDIIKADPLRAADPELPVHVLAAQVQARIEKTLTGPRALFGWRLLALPIAAAAVIVVSILVPRFLPSRPPAVAIVTEVEAPVLSEDALRRLERQLARERAARYLSEAEDVLVNVAAVPRNCDRRTERVDIGDEARRSRELLAERALLVELDGAEVAGARPVLEDVEQVLREVASLENCVRPGALKPIHREMERRHLLMKIDLMTRELLG